MNSKLLSAEFIASADELNKYGQRLQAAKAVHNESSTNNSSAALPSSPRREEITTAQPRTSATQQGDAVAPHTSQGSAKNQPGKDLGTKAPGRKPSKRALFAVFYLLIVVVTFFVSLGSKHETRKPPPENQELAQPGPSLESVVCECFAAGTILVGSLFIVHKRINSNSSAARSQEAKARRGATASKVTISADTQGARISFEGNISDSDGSEWQLHWNARSCSYITDDYLYIEHMETGVEIVVGVPRSALGELYPQWIELLQSKTAFCQLTSASPPSVQGS